MSDRANSSGLRHTAIDIAVTFARQFLSGLLQLGLAVAVSRLLGPDGAGAYALALLIPIILAQLNFGLSSASVYFVASRQFSIEEAWTASRDFLSAVTILGIGLGAVVITSFGSHLFPGVAQEVLLIALLIYPPNLMTGLILSLFQAQQEFRSFNLAILAQPTLATLGLLGLWLVDYVNLVSLMLMVLLSHVVALAFALTLTARSLRLLAPASRRWSYLKFAISYGLKAHIGNMLSLLTYRLDLLLVNYFAGTSAAGLYSVAVRLTEQLWIFSEAFSTVLYPRLAAMVADEESRRGLMPVMARAVLWLTLGSAVLLALIARPLIEALFGTEFVGGTNAMLLLLPGVVLFSCARVLAHDLASRGLVGVNLAIAAGALFLNMFGNLLLLPIYGIAGASAATSIAYACMLLAHLAVQRAANALDPLSVVLPTVRDLRRLLLFFKQGFT